MSNRMNAVAARIAGAALVVGMAIAAQAQVKPGADPELKKLADEFMQAWGKGDAKALAALHAPDAIRIPGDGSVVNGRAAIEANFSQGLSTIWKGSTLTITPGQTQQLSADVAVGEGRYAIKGGTPPPGAPTGGQYLNTYVRQGGRWLVASSGVIAPQPAR